MGRFENLQPQLKPGQFKTESGQNRFITEDGETSGMLSAETAYFLEQCKGTYSIKEIFVLSYDRKKFVGFGDVYTTVEGFAKAGFFKNSKAILDAYKGANESPKTFAVTKNLGKDDLGIHLRKINLFANLPAETIKAIVDASTQKIYAAGEIIIKRDTIGDNAYVLLNGSVGVYSSFYLIGKTEPPALLPPLSVFGESAAVSGKKRTADVVAMTESLVLVVDLKKVIDSKERPVLNKNLRLRLIFNQLMRLHPMFKTLPSEVLQMLLSSCQVEEAEAHKTILQQGEDDGNKFYFILAGSVLVIKDQLPEVQLRTGSFFGEMGVLRRQARTASIVTETDCVFLTLTEKSFITLLASHIRLGVEIEKEIANRSSKPLPEVLSNTDPEITRDITELSELKDYDFSSSLEVENG